MYLLDQGAVMSLLNGNSIAYEKCKANIDNCFIPAIVAAELYAMA